MEGDIYTGVLRNHRVPLVEQSDGTLLFPELKDFYYNKDGSPTNDVTRSFGPVTDIVFACYAVPGQTFRQTWFALRLLDK